MSSAETLAAVAPRSIEIPDFAVVLVVGASGAGKSSFARRHFGEHEILSSDAFRAMVSDDETAQSATDDAFAVMREVAKLRLKRRLRVVIDATNVRAHERRSWVAFAKENDALVAVVALKVPVETCLQRNAGRANRAFGEHVVRRQSTELRNGLKGLRREGFHFAHVLDGVAEIEAVTVAETRLITDKRHDTGPLDVIGDVHGCADELADLIEKLGYVLTWDGEGASRKASVSHPDGRRLAFVGDLVDRGPNSIDVIKIAMGAVRAGGYCAPGNHDDKLKRFLAGRNVKVSESLQGTLDQFDAFEDQRFRKDAHDFLDALPSHIWLDGGRLVIAHAGIKERMIGRASKAIREFCLYGATTGETDAEGYPIRIDWAGRYKGQTAVVYGHTIVARAEWANNTICIDTACVFGGRLTALRWPERELASVEAKREYWAPGRPLEALERDRSAQALADDDLDVTRYLGKRIIETFRMGRLTILEGQSSAAIEVASRFSVDPRWMIYLPPTMSPPEVSKRPDRVEGIEEAFAHYARSRVEQVTLEEKHMGSRAVAVIATSAEAARRRFGVTDDSDGEIYTRTGRPFFDLPEWRDAALSELRDALSASGVFDRLATDWIALDCEILPWSIKAAGMIAQQFQGTADAAMVSLQAQLRAYEAISTEHPGIVEHISRARDRIQAIGRYEGALRLHTASSASFADVRIAPFRVLASESGVHLGEPTAFHHAIVAGLALASTRVAFGRDSSGMIKTTRTLDVTLGEPDSEAAGLAWFESIVASGAEGVVVKPAAGLGDEAVSRQIQPGLKVRGGEYLRLVYGPEYDLGGNLALIKKRSTGAKRALALREYALGEEGLRRFVGGRPLPEVHDCALGVLALESEAVDPTL